MLDRPTYLSTNQTKPTTHRLEASCCLTCVSTISFGSFGHRSPAQHVEIKGKTRTNSLHFQKPIRKKCQISIHSFENHLGSENLCFLEITPYSDLFLYTIQNVNILQTLSIHLLPSIFPLLGLLHRLRMLRFLDVRYDSLCHYGCLNILKKTSIHDLDSIIVHLFDFLC